jgi:hypothetical protein
VNFCCREIESIDVSARHRRKYHQLQSYQTKEGRIWSKDEREEKPTLTPAYPDNLEIPLVQMSKDRVHLPRRIECAGLGMPHPTNTLLISFPGTHACIMVGGMTDFFRTHWTSAHGEDIQRDGLGPNQSASDQLAYLMFRPVLVE